jgi:hypothetical protein
VIKYGGFTISGRARALTEEKECLYEIRKQKGSEKEDE